MTTGEYITEEGIQFRSGEVWFAYVKSCHDHGTVSFPEWLDAEVRDEDWNGDTSWLVKWVE